MDCTAPAAYRIEIYPDRSSWAIEGVAYSCPEHVGVDTGGVIATGAVPEVWPVSESEPIRTCGDVVSYVGAVPVGEAA